MRAADEASAALAPGSLFQQKRGSSASSLSAATSPPVAPSAAPSAAPPSIHIQSQKHSQSQSLNDAAGAAEAAPDATRARRLPAWMQQQQGAPPVNAQKAAPADSPAPSKRARTQRTGLLRASCVTFMHYTVLVHYTVECCIYSSLVYSTIESRTLAFSLVF